MTTRSAEVRRKTSETEIELSLIVDGSGSSGFESGVPFLDHMLSQLACFGLFDLGGSTKGDLEVDAHHTVEDTAVCLGQAFSAAMGDRAGIRRFGWAAVPMDDSLATACVDAGGRPWCEFSGSLSGAPLGGMDGSLLEHFMRSLAFSASITLHMEVTAGRDDHHKAEAAFKALGIALRAALEIDPRRGGLPTTKGAL